MVMPKFLGDADIVKEWSADDEPYLDLVSQDDARNAWLNNHPDKAPPWLTDADELPAQPTHEISAADIVAHEERMAAIRARIKDTPSGAAQRADALAGRHVTALRERLPTVVFGPERPPIGPADGEENDPTMPWARSCASCTIHPDRPACARCVHVRKSPGFLGPCVSFTLTERGRCSRCSVGSVRADDPSALCPACLEWVKYHARPAGRSWDRAPVEPRATGRLIESLFVLSR